GCGGWRAPRESGPKLATQWRGCHCAQPARRVPRPVEEPMATTTLKISGMTCGHCVKSVTEALEDVDGVKRADVDLQQGRATVEYDESRTTPRSLAQAVTEEGYPAEGILCPPGPAPPGAQGAITRRAAT